MHLQGYGYNRFCLEAYDYIILQVTAGRGWLKLSEKEADGDKALVTELVFTHKLGYTRNKARFEQA